MNIAVIGGGIGGLNAAYRLSREGQSVTLYESSHQLGGLGTFFEHDGCYIDKFYHCIMPKDTGLLGLIGDLGLDDQLYWNKTYMGMVYGSQYYKFNTPLDLLRFSAFPFLKRVRLGVGSVLMPRVGNNEALDDVPIGDWLTPIFGTWLWDKFWKPLFTAKFGDSVDGLPALYLKARLGRESNVSDRGYLEGGLKRLIDTIEAAIRNQGSTVLTDTRIQELSVAPDGVTVSDDKGNTHTYDKVISTVPAAVLRRIAPSSVSQDTLPDVPHQGVVNTLFLLKRRVFGDYWAPVIDSETEFDGIVESSALIKPEHYGGHHAAYVMRYTSADSELFAQSDEDIEQRWTAQLLAAAKDSGLQASDIASVHVFRTPYVEPLYPLGYKKIQPPFELVKDRLYAATTAHVYPGITSWNSSIDASNACLSVMASEAS